MLARAKEVMRASNQMLIARAAADNPALQIPAGADEWEPRELHALVYGGAARLLDAAAAAGGGG
eukprot:SAG22_NODE_14040_length_386_cov_2.508711_1_plen_63_part_01